jgi:hypothetical protein
VRLCRPRAYADVGIGSPARCGLPCDSGRHNPDMITVLASGHCRDRAAWRGHTDSRHVERVRAETPCRRGHRCLQGAGPVGRTHAAVAGEDLVLRDLPGRG